MREVLKRWSAWSAASTLAWMFAIALLLLSPRSVAALDEDSSRDRERAWPEAHITLLPKDLRPLVRTSVRSDGALLQHIDRKLLNEEDPSSFLTRIAVDECLETEAGVEGLLSILAESAELKLEMTIAERFALFGFRFGAKDPSSFWGGPARSRDLSRLAPQIAGALEAEIAEAATAESAIAFTRYFLDFQKRRVIMSIASRIPDAKKAEDTKGADYARYVFHQLWNAGALPKFVHKSFPVLAPKVEHGDRIRILAFGDFGTGDENQTKTAEAMRVVHQGDQFHFGVTLGDNFYPEGLSSPSHGRWASEWEKPYGELGIPFFPVLGNHDYYGEGAALAEILYSDASDSWNMPAPNYSFRVGPVELFAIETNVLLDDQLTWLKRKLADSTAQWKIVYGHHPIFLSGGQNDKEPNDLVGRLLPILLEGGVNLWLNGHDHAMEEYAPIGDLHFFTIGSGGAEIYEKPADANSVFRSEAHGFGVIEVESAKFTVRFLDDEGTLLHERVISKN